MNIDDLHALHQRSSFQERQAIAGEFAKRINDILESENICRYEDNFSSPDAGDISALENDGYMALGQLLDAAQVTETRQHFEQTDCYNAHLVAKSDGIARPPSDLENISPFGSYHQDQVVAAPNLLELANSPALIERAARYLGCTPTLYSMNAWWSFPGHTSPDLLGQGIHRDEDDFKNCVLFVYLTDATATTGAHEYIKGTHRQDRVQEILTGTSFPLVEIERDGKKETVQVTFDALFSGAGYDGDPVYHALFADQFDIIEGQAGSAFLSDTSGLHHGRPPLENKRLLAWIRYGLYKNKAYLNDQLSPAPYDWSSGRIPDDARHRYINRLILEAD